MKEILEDLRHASRRLMAAPGFTSTAMVSLALAIAGCVTIFSALDTLLLRPLPVRDATRLVRILGVYERYGGASGSLSLPNVADIERGTRSFEDVAAYRMRGYTIGGAERPERLMGARVAWDLWRVLGVAPVLGRGFGRDEDRPGGADVLLLSYGLWQRRFGGARDVIGRTVILDGVAHTVVGVMPRGFEFPFGASAELWTPLAADEATWGRASNGVQAVARLASGAALDRALGELAVVGRELAAEYPATNSGLTFTAVGLPDDVYGEEIRLGMFALLGAVWVVLVLACVNVGSVMLARGVDREREIAIRAAVGGGRTRIARLLVLEGVVLGLAAGASALLLALWGIRAVGALAPEGIPRLEQMRLDGRVLAVATGISLLAGILASVIPALRASRPGLASLLRAGGRGSAPQQRIRLRRVMVASEVALAIMLLFGAGLLYRSLENLLAVDPGFEAKGLLTAVLSLDAQYDSPESISTFQVAAFERLRGLPGIVAASAVHALPLGGEDTYADFRIEGRADRGPSERLDAATNFIATGYFDAMGIPLQRGRSFTEKDTRETAGAVVVSRRLAEKIWPGEDPLGERIHILWDERNGEPYWRIVVGVVGDVRHSGLDRDPRAEMYIPYAQLPWPVREMTIVVRTSLDPSAQAAAVQAAIQSVDPGQPVHDLRTMSQRIRSKLGYSRVLAQLLAIFAGVALALAGLGLYGVVSYWVAQRRREIGIRSALGGGSRQIVMLVAARATAMVGLGMVLGGFASIAAGRLLGNLLFHVSPLDPPTFIVVGAVLVLAGAAAAALPTRRALRIDPVEALRTD